MTNSNTNLIGGVEYIGYIGWYVALVDFKRRTAPITDEELERYIKDHLME